MLRPQSVLLTFLLCLAATRPGVGQCLTSPAGLLSWWPAEGSAEDVLGGNPGVLTNGVSFAAGYIGDAFRFAGTGAIVRGASASLTRIENTFTIEFWVLPGASRANTSQSTSGTVGTRDQRYAIAPEHGGSSGPAGVGVSVGTNGISIFEHAASYLPSPLVYNVNLKDWTHVAVVYEDKKPSLYVNGALAKVGLTSPRASVFPSKTFGNVNNYGQFLGLLDEVSLYGRSLSPTEITGIYRAGRDGKCRTTRASEPIYRQDFEGDIGREWSAPRVETTPLNARRFLGQFGSETVTLTLTNLPPHKRLTLALDVFVIRTWDGNNGGPDVWEVGLVNGPTLLHSTFQNEEGRVQAFPEDYPGGFFRAGTGALEWNTLGYGQDAVYRRLLTFPHTDDALRLSFRGIGLQSVSDESWGLDNLTLFADGPEVKFQSPTIGAEFAWPTNIVLTATSEPGSSPVERVDFLSDNVLLGSDEDPPYTMVWTNVPAGLHVVTLRATDGLGRTAEAIETIRVNGLAGEYYGGTPFFTGPVRRLDPTIDFDWVSKPPAAGVPGTYFSARWTGEIEARFSEIYTFYVSGDDNFRLWIDGRRLVDDWRGGSRHTRQGTIQLIAGQRYTIQLDYYQGAPGGANLTLEWASRSQLRQVIPARWLFPPQPGENRSPNSPVITSPPAEGWAVAKAGDLLLSTDGFWDPDTGQEPTAAEWEIWRESPLERVWRSFRTDLASFLTNRLSTGTFEGSHTGRTTLMRASSYRLRVRYRDNSRTSSEWGRWAERTFETRNSTLASSTFDKNLEGWAYLKLKPNLRPGFAWVSAGVPGGCLFVDEYGNGDGDQTWLQAPEKFVGDLSTTFGGALAFDMRLTIPAEPWTGEMVQIHSPNGMMVARPSVRPGTDWTHYVVPLTPDVWTLGSLAGPVGGWDQLGANGPRPSTEQFQAILSNVQQLLISGEYVGVSYSDNCYLDNVRLIAPQHGDPLRISLRNEGLGRVEVSWSSDEPDPVLEATEHLGTGPWRVVEAVISTRREQGRTLVTLEPTNGCRFFRLRKE